jgi:predicted RNA-binding protein YlqC (UPF0109 family)
MAMAKLGNGPWDNSDVKQESIKAIKSVVEEANNFNSRASIVRSISSGTFNLGTVVHNQGEGIYKKIINNPQDLMLTKADLPHNKIIEID